MAETPEGKVKSWLRKAMKERYPESWHYAAPAGPYGQVGVADDLWVIKAGNYNVFAAIESKADHTRKPTVPQLEYLRKIKKLNGICAIMYGRDKDKLNLIFKNIDDTIKQLENLSE